MFMTATCPTCGNKFRVPERALGQPVECPACARFFQCGSVAPPSLRGRPLDSEKSDAVQEMPAARAAQVQAPSTIRYRCARCNKPLESPAHLAGHKINCPDCGQRLQVPPSSAPPPADNRTSIANEEPPRVPVVPVQIVRNVPHPPIKEEPILTVVPLSRPAPLAAVQREYCLECGLEVTQRAHIQTCPDCGSLFCSAHCYRDHCHHAHRR